MTYQRLTTAHSHQASARTVLPTFAMFNVNNSDAIISTVTNNVLSGSNGFANSVMQPRMIGVGAQVKW